MTAAEIKARKREDYPYMLDYRTRWNDNDMYDHMNNSVYNFIIDSVVNDYCIKYAGLSPPTSTETPLVVHSHTDFISSIAYPAVAEVGLRVNKLGKSSVTYEVGIFEKGVEGVKAVGELVHVWTDRDKGRPRAQGMSDRLRNAFERIKVGSEPVAKL